MAKTEERPLVTFALFAYNQERYVAEAVAGAFAQDYSPLEIILSDDCSTDSTFEIMQRMVAEYKGPHKIVLNRNERNLGIGGHVQTIFSRAAGDVIVPAAGDDLSKPNRTSRCVEEFRRRPGALAFISGFDYFNSESEHLPGWWRPCPEEYSLQNFAKGLINVPGAAAAWHRSLIAGWPLMDGVIHEDRVLPFRVMLLGGTIASVEEALVTYRATGGVSRYTELGSRNNLRGARLSTLGRIFPDAVRRFDDWLYASRDDKDVGLILRNEIDFTEMQVSILNSPKFHKTIKILLKFALSSRYDILYIYFRIILSEKIRI